ncbi:hypothetical protein [Pseudomonas sp. EL_65y_Pfl2_R95]|uniref:hypothetical protein n=1 Tax=Pseudomonas sp. EL_65y_Pfl2_R95 TaxID=3088698 RepID=UPI0030DAB8F7
MIGQPQWSFLPLSRGAKARDPVQDEFFQEQSIGGLEHALVRETIQNSLDARAGKDPVRIVFSLGKLPAEQALFWFPEEVQAHFSAKEISLARLPEWNTETCSYLTIEDFGTNGLEGKVNTTEPEAGGNFYHFFRAEGLSNKGDGARGSWGVGKIVIPRTSRVRSFFAATIRASEPRLHLMGQTTLRHHTIAETQYTPDGWFSKEEGGLQVPFTNDEVTARLNSDFRLTRENEPGLGLVIPWVYEEHVTLERLASAIAREYFIPILAGNLIVELRDHCSDKYQRFDASSFEELERSDLENEQFQDAIQLAGNLLQLGQSPTVKVDVIHESGSSDLDYDWSSYKTSISPQDIESALEHGQVVHFRVPMVIKPAKSLPERGHFDVLIKRKPGRHFPIYIRDELIIPNLTSRKRTPDSVALIHTSNSAIADALRRAECPAHTDWKSSRDKFQEQKYSTALRLIPFVRESALKLLDKLMTEEGKPDHNLLAAVLPLPASDAPPQASKDKESIERKKNPQKTPEIDIPNIPAPTPRCWKLKQSAGEIHLVGNPEGFTNSEGYTLNLRAAYDLRGRNPFKAHSRFDFDLHRAATKGVDDKSGFIIMSNDAVKVVNGGYDSLVLHVTDPHFEMTFLAADLNRDLIMKVGSTPFGESSDEDEETEE